MAMAHYEAEKFNGKSDFGLWRIKMKALLIHQGLAGALTPEEGDDKPAPTRQEVLQKAHSAIILSLDDKVLREVAHETSASAIWKKLEDLYMVKSLANRLYLKQQLYSYRLTEGKTLSEQLDLFSKFVDDLENVDVKLADEDKAIVLLNALPPSYEQLKDALLYGRDKSITFLEVQTALKAKEFQKMSQHNKRLLARS